MQSKRLNEIFRESIQAYYQHNDIQLAIPNPYPVESLEGLIFQKNWIDNRQWNLEDLIRDRQRPPADAIEFKWEIDRCNQERTDTVETIDELFFTHFQEIKPLPDAFLSTETPAWAIDRLSILHIKIYHMHQKLGNAEDDRIFLKSQHRLQILLTQLEDLGQAIDQLFDNIYEGRCVVRTYKQMKMYNDPDFNPYLKNPEVKIES
ncbi:MAG: DUF4254 domain-containing protein [Bacteroidota bacterium]